MKLAAHLGRTLDELGQTMSLEELTYWLAKERLDPLPDSWLQNGLSCSITANCMGGNKTTPQDFIPVKREPVNPKTVLAAWAGMQKKKKKEKK